MGLKAESEQQGGWTTVAGRRARVQGETKDDKTRSGGGGRDPSTAGPGRLIKVSPRKTQNKNKTEGILQSKNGGEGEGGDAKKGRETFKQLRRYLLQDAKQEYVLHTIIRLGELASSRRFLHWVMVHKKDRRTEQELKKDWKDQPTAAQTDMYQNVQSYWDLRVPEHARGLCQVMLQWEVTENLDQDEVERLLHFFHIQGGPESKAAVSSSGTAGNSYLGAVNSGRTMSGGKVETNEQKRMKELCTRPVERVVELRGRTADEDRALIMILNHELELARPPTFLVQSMDAEELAVFTDLFHAIEFPLYAHLAPGQRFDNDMACESILRMVHAGREAAPQHKQEILEFKAAMSRILPDAETRLITVTFKGKQSAARWIGWKMPFAAKLLPLVDYKQQREEAKKTHALVQIDFYEFSVAVRRGTMNSRDIYWLLTRGLGLEVQEMKHPEASTLGVNDKEWIVTVKGAACPAKLREIAFITIDDVDMVVHHHTIHAYWPCRTCHSPDHSTKSCRVEAKELGGKHAEHGMIIQGRLPTKLKNQGQLAVDAELPTTIEQLQLLLNNSRMAGSNSRKAKQTKVGDSKQTKSRARSPSKRGQQEPIDRPVLPMEWEMHRQPVHQQEEEPVDHERQCADGGCKLEKESKTEESTPPYYGTMSPEENNSNLPEDNVEQQAAEGDFDGAGDEKMREVSVEGENVNTQSEAGSSKDEGDEVAFSRAERGRSPTRILRNRGSRGGSRFDAPKQDGHRDGFATGPARTRKSVSPKRTAPAEWEQEGNDQSEGSRKKVKQDGKRSGVTRSLSPRKRGQLSPKKRDKKSHQQYMHQYLLETFQATASKHRRLGGSPVFSSTGDTVENLEARKQAYQVVKEAADGEDTEGHPKETEDSDCVYAGTKPGSDAGEALETWIAGSACPSCLDL
ncbi:hypothetical protein PF003_g36154 [Phytophthora fragariae]|nr:hypothetical protein PF003_g36154 [Phytophthora fragariae]